MGPPTSSVATEEPPRFLRVVGHPVRWALLKQLSRGDRSVKELTGLLDQGQSLVSYHLKELRDAGLVRSRRSSADDRDSYQSVDLEAYRDLLGSTGTALHPGLRLIPDLAPPTPSRVSSRRPRVIFLCTGNGSRSQIAEALLQARSSGDVDVVSAGSRPKPVHPNAVRVLAERGIDISDRSSKHLDGFTDRRFDHVITLCDRVREVCPEFPGRPETAHWSIPDPALKGDTPESSYPAFVRTADELDTRIRFFLSTINQPARRSGTDG